MVKMTPHHKEKILFKSTDGYSLTGEIFRPDTAAVGTVILCHPHPLYGGNMNNNVVDTLWNSLPGDGFLSFRFNFRGVGSSEGNFEEGIGETHDLKGAIQFLTDSGYKHLPCFLFGYSFGAYVIHLLNPLPPNVKGIAMISPPVSMSVFDPERFRDCSVFFIAGDLDHYCGIESLQMLVNKLKIDKSLKVIPEIDHFWFGKEKILYETIRPWLLVTIQDQRRRIDCPSRL